MNISRNQSLTALVFLCSIVVMYWILEPGIYGPYILDDLVHFPRLEGGVYDTESFVRWVFGGGTHGSGRPISYLSFLVDDNAWPNRPEDLKSTNLYVHLLVGVLVFSLARQLFKLQKNFCSENKADWLALLVACVWLVAPMHQSAVFMAIQRMTLLMGAFVFAGVGFYIWGRSFVSERLVSGYFLMSVGVGFFGLLAALSKEPGVLICLYVLVLEFTVLREVVWRDKYKWCWKLAFLYLPLLLVVAFYATSLGMMDELYAKRDFNAFERVLTQFRVLTSYIWTFVFPHGALVGPYQDDFIPSRGWFSPVTTAVSALGVVFVIAGAVVLRKRFSLLSCGVLWFFAAHVLESSILPIELYFEHRNYIALFGLVIAFASVPFYLGASLWRVYVVVSCFFVSFQLYSSIVTAQTWGNRDYQSQLWGGYHPNSYRAQLDLIRVLLDGGRPDVAMEVSRTIIDKDPNAVGIQLYLYLVDLCLPDYGDKFYRGDIDEVLLNGKFDHSVYESLKFLRKNRKNGRCSLSQEQLEEHLLSLVKNKNFIQVKSVMGALHEELARNYIDTGRFGEMMAALDKAYFYLPRYNIALNQAYLLMEEGLLDDSAEYILKARNAPSFNKYDFLWRENEIDIWSERLRIKRLALEEGGDL